MDLAQRAVEFERGFLILVKNGEPVVESRRLPRGEAPGTVEISRTVLDHVVRTRESILTEDALVDGRLGESGGVRRQHIRSVMCVPLAANDELLGMLYVDSRREAGLFGERELRMLTFLANLAAVKLDQARLFQKAVEGERIRKELWEAARIQARLLPSEAPSIPGYLLDGRTLPCHEVGGDSYDYLAMQDGRYGIALADVTGKGLPAAMLLSSFQLGLRGLSGFGLPLDDLLGRLNRLLITSIPDNCYVALFLGVLDPASHTLTFVNAGHGPPLVFRGSAVERLELGAFPLGCFPRVSFQPRAIELEPGDCLVCYSDGITEARDAEERLFGEDRLINLVREAADRPPAEKIGEVIAAVKGHCPEGRTQDDVTLVILERQVEG